MICNLKNSSIFAFFLALFLTANPLSSQNGLEYLANCVEMQSLKIPSDRVFLHIDRNQYYQGDTIYLQSYIQNRFTQKFETKSNSLWVLLYNLDGAIIDSARFRIDFAQAPGWLVIPNSCKSGLYKLCAFTSQMQNFDVNWAFSLLLKVVNKSEGNLTIEYSLDKNVYQSKDTVGISLRPRGKKGKLIKNTSFNYSFLINNKLESTYTARTSKDGKALIRLYLPDSLDKKRVQLKVDFDRITRDTKIEIPIFSDKLIIDFLPEGGHLIPGFKQRIAFNAIKQNGDQIFLAGVLKDNQGTVVDSIYSGKLGPGLIEFTPKHGHSYHAEFSKYEGELFELPNVDESVPSIRVNSMTDFLLVDILSERTDEKYFIALTKNYKILAFKELNLINQKRIKFLTNSLPTGMARVTLFDSNFKPIAERCTYIQSDTLPKCNILPQFEFYLPNQETELQIEFLSERREKVAGIFSIAVVDSVLGLNPNFLVRNIEDELLFEKEFYDKIPLHIKHEGLSSLSSAELDLLFLTYGWTRYNWNYKRSFEHIDLIDYDRYIIDVTYSNLSARKKRVISRSTPLFIIAPDEQVLVGLNSINNNSFLFEIDSLPRSAKSIMILPNHTHRVAIKNVMLNAIVNNNFFQTLRDVDNQSEYNSNIQIQNLEDPIITTDSIIVINDVNVYAQRTQAKLFANEYEERYQNHTTRTVNELALETAMSFEDLIRRLNPKYINTQNKTVHFRSIGRISGEPPPALFVLDGVPQEASYRYLLDINPNNIHSVTALIGPGGFYFYGEEAIGGVVFVETKLNNLGNDFETGGDKWTGSNLGKVIQLFRPTVEFYNPPLEIVNNSPEYWIRPTLYWNPDVFYDGQEPVTIRYYNHKKKGKVAIIVNGVTIHGEPISGVYKYNIR